MKKVIAKAEVVGEAPSSELVAKRLSGWFPDLAPEILGRLTIYHENLLKFTKAVNLISANTIKNAEAVHVADAVMASQILVGSLVPGKPIYDFGSGNGCPGIILAALYPERSVILVDRDKRKMEFCKHVVSAMNLKNVTCDPLDVEEITDNSVHNGIARGFAPFTKALIMCRKQFVKGGRFLHLKTDGWANEMAQMPSQVFTHWSPSLIGKYRIPESNADLAIVMTEKLTSEK